MRGGKNQLGARLPRIVLRVYVFNAQWPNGHHLRDVLAGLGPMKVGCIAGQNDYGAWRIRLQFISGELITQTNVEDAGDDGVYPILGVSVWHQLNSVRHLDPDRVETFVQRLTHNNGETHRRRER